ncbi:MAG: hypothetical protein RBQ94_03800, partial [Methanimicrococcus sp.]|nr:hypothetical protein [Methanimicrococcus sp.]
SVMVGGGEMYRIDGSGQGTLTTFDTKAELADWDEKVQKITADAMKKNQKSGNLPVSLGILAFVLLALVFLAVGAAAVIFIAARNKK